MLGARIHFTQLYSGLPPSRVSPDTHNAVRATAPPLAGRRWAGKFVTSGQHSVGSPAVFSLTLQILASSSCQSKVVDWPPCLATWFFNCLLCNWIPVCMSSCHMCMYVCVVCIFEYIYSLNQIVMCITSLIHTHAVTRAVKRITWNNLEWHCLVLLSVDLDTTALFWSWVRCHSCGFSQSLKQECL